MDTDGVLNPKPSPKLPVSPENGAKVGGKSAKQGYNDPVQKDPISAVLDDAKIDGEASKAALPRSRSGSPF